MYFITAFHKIRTHIGPPTSFIRLPIGGIECITMLMREFVFLIEEEKQ